MVLHVKIGPQVPISEIQEIAFFFTKMYILWCFKIGTRESILTCETIFPLKIKFLESFYKHGTRNFHRITKIRFPVSQKTV